MWKRLLRTAGVLIALAAAVLAVVHAAGAWRERRDAAERAASPQGRLPAAVRPTDYEVELRIDPREDRFEGKTTITVAVDDRTEVIWLHGKDLEAAEVAVLTGGGRRIEADYREMGRSGVVRLQVAEPLDPGEATIEIVYAAELGHRLAGAYRVDVDDASYVFTQFQAIDARRVFPCFDEPAYKTPFDLVLAIRPADVAVANTPQVHEEGDGDGWKRIRFETTPPLPTYLLAFAIGPLDVVDGGTIPPNAVRPRPVPLRGVATAGRGREMGYALAETATILEELETYFDSPYPFRKLDLVAVPDFAAGAMENPGLVTYQEHYLLIDDQPSAEEQREYGPIQAHELAHMWVGDLVTMPWWDDTWLNEGFASWMEYRIAARWRPDLELDRERVRSAHEVMEQDALVTARRVRQPIASNHDIENAFDGITYQKGAAVLHMFESYLGEERFRAGVRAHLQRFAWGTATSEDFLDSLAAGADDGEVVDSLPTFLEQPGVPLVEVGWTCGEGVELRLLQSRYLPVGSRGSPDQLWRVPVCWRPVGTGAGPAPETRCVLLSERETVVTERQTPCPAAVMPDAGAEGYYRWSLPEAGWRSLFESLDELTPEEVFSLIDNLGAELHGGRIGIDFYLEGARRVAALESWDLVLAPREELLFIADYLVPEERRPEMLELIRELYAPRLRRLGLRAATELDRREPVSAALLRQELVSLLALDVRWTELRGELLEPGRASIESGSAAVGIDPQLVSTAMTVALEEEGEPLYRELLEQLKASDDDGFRSDAIWALGQVTDPELAGQVRGLVRSLSLRLNEKATLIMLQMEEPSQGEALFDWTLRYYDLVAALMPETYLAQAPWIAAGFCEPERAEQVRSFFEPRMHEVTGGPGVLSTVLEEIELCAALAESLRGGRG